MTAIRCGATGCKSLDGIHAYRLTIAQGTPPGVTQQPLELCRFHAARVAANARELTEATGGQLAVTLEIRQ